jgi:hypothetical protein
MEILHILGISEFLSTWSVRSTEEFLAEVQQALQANGPVVALRIQTHMGMTRQASATISNSCHN